MVIMVNSNWTIELIIGRVLTPRACRLGSGTVPFKCPYGHSVQQSGISQPPIAKTALAGGVLVDAWQDGPTQRCRDKAMMVL
jgi:hypothetical protein